MKIYVLRHGQTDGNKKKMMQGNLDIELNDVGRAQALEARQIISKLGIDLIICSPLKRTRQTAIIACPNTPIIYDNRLRSRNHGEFMGMSRDEINLKEYWNIRENKQYKEAESVQTLYERVVSLLSDIKKKYSDKTVLLVTHSGITRILYYYFHGIPEDGDLTEYQSVNTSIESYVLEES